MTTQQDRMFMQLSKLRPNEDWGHFFFDILVDDENMSGQDTKFQYNYPEIRMLREPMIQG